MPRALQTCVIDTSVVINLFRGGVLEDLFRLSSRVLTTKRAFGELKYPPALLTQAEGLQRYGLDPAETQRLYQLKPQHKHLSLPDLSVFLLAQRSGEVLLTDDSGLQELAEQNQVHVCGTLWVYEQAVDARVLTPFVAAQSLERLRNHPRCWLPKEECSAWIARWRGGP